MRRICVFCGSNFGNSSAYAHAATELGRVLVARGIGLIYGGSNAGLMGTLADAMLAAGGHVIGVIPRSLVDREVAHPALPDLHVVETMHQRKGMMADLADGFIAMPGGYGTFDELCEILTWAQLGIHSKPVGLLNTLRYWDPFLHFLDRAVDAGFLRSAHRQLLQVSEDPAGLLDLLLRARPSAPQSKWMDPEVR